MKFLRLSTFVATAVICLLPRSIMAQAMPWYDSNEEIVHIPYISVSDDLYNLELFVDQTEPPILSLGSALQILDEPPEASLEYKAHFNEITGTLYIPKLQVGEEYYGLKAILESSPDISFENVEVWPLSSIGLSRVDQHLNTWGVPGVSIAVIEDFRIIDFRSFGVKNRSSLEPVSRHTLFQAASISKSITAMASLRMSQDDKLNLDEPVNLQLTSNKIPENGWTVSESVTLRRILSHTGGLTVHGFGGYQSGQSIPTLTQILYGSPPANNPPITVFTTPGTVYQYSGGGFTYAQQLLIDIEQAGFSTIIESTIFDPIGMDSSSFSQPLPASLQSRAATGHLPNHSSVVGGAHVYPEMAAAGLWTTAFDLALFVIDLMKSANNDSGFVLSEQSANLMTSPVIHTGNGVYAGLGIFVRKAGTGQNAQVTLIGHGGWNEGFSSEYAAHKAEGYGIVVLTNSNHPDFISAVIQDVFAAYGW